MVDLNGAGAELSAKIMDLMADIEAENGDVVSSIQVVKDEIGRLQDISIVCHSKLPPMAKTLGLRVANLHKLFVSTQILYLVKDFETANGVGLEGFEFKTDDQGKMINLEVIFSTLVCH